MTKPCTSLKQEGNTIKPPVTTSNTARLKPPKNRLKQMVTHLVKSAMELLLHPLLLTNKPQPHAARLPPKKARNANGPQVPAVDTAGSISN